MGRVLDRQGSAALVAEGMATSVNIMDENLDARRISSRIAPFIKKAFKAPLVAQDTSSLPENEVKTMPCFDLPIHAASTLIHPRI